MKQKITFIGLGKMGSAIAEQLIKVGFSLTVYNRTFDKTKPLVSMGAKAESSIESAVHDADIIFTSVFDDAALISVTAEILKHLKQGAIHVSTSTILPKTASMLAKQHADTGFFYVAAPVFGVPKSVRAKTATTICGGDENAIETVMPLFNAYSGVIENLGEGASEANVLKICINYSLISALELISELYVFAEKSDLETDIIQKTLKKIYGHPGFHLYIDKIRDQSFDDVNFDVQCGDKDVYLFQQAFSEVGVIPDIANMVRGKFTQAMTQDMSDKDWSAISEIVRKRSGLNEK